ncbi:MAG: hypothetical protein A2Z34_00465 [Planctomycetes bacterium RBG_16_59_8]|nr:MAG: hypothetical protein A2Z34_00465 [Planctomycetes bacterium RBG_16_59_8]
MAMAVTGEAQERLKKIVSNISGLPTLPSMLSNINKMMLNPRTSAKEIAQLISSDPTITAKVLRVVNSSFYGFPNRITTITHAIVILGFNTIKSIVLSSTIFDVFKTGAKDARFDRTEFWKHSIGCGAAARVVGKMLGHSAIEELFIAGLVHDIGKIVLDQYAHEKFLDILDVVSNRNCLIVQAEEDVLGFTHAEVGGWLFEKWNLSKGLVDCVKCHHNPALAGDHQRLVAIVHLADIVTRAIRCGSGGDRKIPAIAESSWQALGLKPENFDAIIAGAGEEIEKAMVFLDFIK